MKIHQLETARPTHGLDVPTDPPVRLIGLLLALITVLVYLPVGSHGFISFDDADYISENGMVQNGLTWDGFIWAFAGWHASNWHPLTWLSHQLDCQLFGLNAGAHHLVSVLFHAANTVLLFQLWRRLTNTCWPAAGVAALFAWHPLHVESVAWAAERKDVLSTFFGLLALLAYGRDAEAKIQNSKSKGQRPKADIRLRWSRFYWASLAAFALALLAKPMLVTLPFVLLLLDFWPLRRGTGERPFLTEWRPLIREKWPFFLLSGIFCLLTFLAQRQSAVISLQQLSPGFRLKNAVVSYAGYLGQILWPTDLGLIYQLPGRISAGEVVFPGVVLLVISLLVWRWRRSQPWFLTGWLWFLGMLAPVIGLVQVGNQARADRYTYLSAVGLYVAAVFGVARMRARFQWPTGPVWLAAILILTGSVLVTEHQLTFWRDSETLYQHTLAVTSNNGSMHLLLGSLYEHQGRSEEARRQYHAALDCFALTYVNVDGEERPCAAQVQLFFGQDAEQKGRPDEAMAHYREALRLDDHLVEAHNNLGNLLDEQGRSAEALTHYESAVRLRPETALVHENLGTELVTLGRFDEAMREYQVAARLAPAQPQPWYLTGKARLRHGDSQAAVAAFEAALRLDAEDVPSLTFLARVLASDETPRIRDGARAVTLAEKANTLTAGRQPFVLGALAMAYAECGRFTDARQTARTALELATNGSGRMLANQREQLQLYEADRPFRESFTPSPAPPSEPPPPSTSNAGGHR